MADWLVGQALPKHEMIAHASLTGVGFNCYQPKIRELSIVRGQKKWSERLLLGRYFLVEMTSNFSYVYHVIMDGCRGVHSILMADELPLVVREHEVETLRQSEVKGCIPVTVIKNRFTKGQRVIITKGAFINFEAQYDIGKDDRDAVLLNILGRETVIEVELGSLIAA